MLGDLGDERVVEAHDRSAPGELGHDLDGGRLAQVADIGLVRHAEHEHPCVLHGEVVVVERVDDAGRDVLRHRRVDVLRRLDEPERASRVAAALPRQVRRVERDAVPADAWTGVERHVAERLAGRRPDDLPHVDVLRRAEGGELVDQRDVHHAEGVLEQLGHLGGPRARHGDHVVDQLGVEQRSELGRVGVHATDDPRRVAQAVLRVARVDPLGGVGEQEVVTCPVAVLLQQRSQQGLGGARVGRGLEDHQAVGAKVRSDVAPGGLDEGQVGPVLGDRRGDADQHDVRTGRDRRIGAEADPPGVHRLGEELVVDARDDVAPCCERGDSLRVQVHAGDGHARDRRAGGHGQADVPLADDSDRGRASGDTCAEQRRTQRNPQTVGKA